MIIFIIITIIIKIYFEIVISRWKQKPCSLHHSNQAATLPEMTTEHADGKFPFLHRLLWPLNPHLLRYLSTGASSCAAVTPSQPPKPTVTVGSLSRWESHSLFPLSWALCFSSPFVFQRVPCPGLLSWTYILHWVGLYFSENHYIVLYMGLVLFE